MGLSILAEVMRALQQYRKRMVNKIAPIASAAPRAMIFRAFNSLGRENFAEPVIAGEQVDLLLPLVLQLRFALRCRLRVIDSRFN